MVKFQHSIDEFEKKISDLIKYYTQMSEKDPFTDQYLQAVNDYAEAMKNEAQLSNELLEKKISDLNIVYDELLSDYSKKKHEYDQTITTTHDVISAKYQTKIKEEKNKISILKKNNKYAEGNIKQDIYFFLTSSNQKLDILEQEYNENKNRFDYQIKASNETYEDNIKKRDMLLDNSLTQVRQEHSTNLIQFDEDCKSILQKLDSKITKLNNKLSELQTIEQGIENKYKAQARQESIEFNSIIKVLQENKNKEIVEAKDNYTNSLYEDNIEKENKHKSINDDIQQVMKEFVSSINALDDRLSKIKQEYQSNHKKLKQMYFYELIDINRKQTIETKVVMNDLKKQKILLKAVRKKYYFIQQTTKNKTNSALKSLDIEYNENLENIRHERALAELNKNQAIKKLTETEQSNNKHYQEQSNIYENRMNLDIFMANAKYNQEANKYKCDSRKRSIALEKDYTDSILKLRKEIKSTTTEIKKIDISIQCVKDLNKLLHDQESKEFNKKTNYLSVNTLLEIEKHKALKVYNDQQYNYNIANAKALLDYSKEKIGIQNNEYETLNRATIEINKLKLEREINNINHHIIDLGIEELEEQTIQARNTHYQLDSLIHQILKSRFNQEIRIINQITSTLLIHIKKLESFVAFFINKLFDDLKVRQEYISFIQFFIDDILKIVEEYHNDLFSNFSNCEAKIINDRLQFEEDFKFKENYEKIETEFNSDKNYLEEKKKDALSLINKCKSDIDIASSRISSMYNQIEHVKSSNKSSETKQKEIHQLKLRINVLKSDIGKEQERIDSLYQNIELYDKDVKEIEARYQRQDKDLKELQFNSAKSFRNLQEEIEKLVLQAKQKQSTLLHPNPESYSYNSIKAITNKIVTSFNKTNYENISYIYQVINTFSNDTIEAISRDKKLLLYKYRNDLMQINEDISKKFNNNETELDEENNKSDVAINYLERDYNSKENNFKNQLEQCEKQFANKSQEILDLKDESTSHFYLSFYAVDNNSLGITNNYNQYIINTKKDFQTNKNRLVYNETTNKNNLTSELNSYIIQNDEAIKHLPEASKLQSIEAESDTKNKNRDIDQNILENKENFHDNQKSIHKNIDEIKSNLLNTIFEIESDYQKDLKNENKIFMLNLKKISKGTLDRTIK